MRCCSCKSENIIIDGCYVCTDCGTVQPEEIYVHTYDEEMNIRKKPTYKRTSHFSEHLNHLMALELTNIDDITVDMLKKHFKEIPTKTQLRKVIPKKYIRNVPLIMKLCWNIPPIAIQLSDESMFKQMFFRIVNASVEYNLKHFIHLDYILHQLCVLKGRSQYLDKIARIKNCKTIEKYNHYWKKICEKLKWKYMPYI